MAVLDIPGDSRRAMDTMQAGGIAILPNDVGYSLIAAHASALGATLVTANMREFGRVRGLRVENWLA